MYYRIVKITIEIAKIVGPFIISLTKNIKKCINYLRIIYII